MSHTATVDVQFKDQAALTKAAKAAGAEILGHGTVKLFDGKIVEGLRIQLYHMVDGVRTAWKYPIVVTKDNKATFDNYNGKWGDMKSFHALKKAYTEFATIHRAAKIGQKLVRKVEKNGFVRLELA